MDVWPGRPAQPEHGDGKGHAAGAGQGEADVLFSFVGVLGAQTRGEAVVPQTEEGAD